MKIETAFSCGDKGWTFDYETGRIKQRTIGQVRVEYTQSPGIGDGWMEGSVASYSGGYSGDGVADNYQPKEPETVETYMCVETGIGSGSVYTLGEHIFLNEEDCRIANVERLAEIQKEKQARAEWERKDAERRLALLQYEMASLEKKLA